MTKSDDFEKRILSRGPTIGTYREAEIPAFIIYEDGTKMMFDRVANRDANGACNMDQFYPGEVMIAPGLIYRKEGSAP